MATTSSNPIPTSYPVAPGTTVTREVYTDIGFNNGDYVYSLANGSVGLNPTINSTAGAFNITLPIAGAAYTTYSQSFVTATLNRANITAPQSSNISVTYSGSTTTFGGTQLSSTTVQSTASQQGPASCVLTNGNIVTVFNNNTGTTLYYQITTPSGSAVANGTVATNLYSTDYSTSYGRNYNICALNAGGFAVVWTNSSGYLSAATYSATGTSIISSTQILSSAAYYPSIAVTTGDIAVITASNNWSSNIGSIYICGNGLANGATRSQGLTNNAYYSETNCNILITSSNVIYVTGMDRSSSSVLWYQYYNDLTLSNTSNYTSLVSFYSWPYAPAITQTSNGYIILLFQYAGTTYIQVYAPKSTSTLAQATSSSYFYVYGCNFLIPYAGSLTGYSGTTDAAIGFGIDSSSGSTFASLLITFNSSTNAITVSNKTLSSLTTSTYSSYWLNRMSVVPLFGNYFAILYAANSTQYPTVYEVNTFPLTNGQSYSLTTSFNPSTGYNLIGVAGSNAAANSYGSVVVNGTVPLSSSYGTSSTPKFFNYNPTNKSPSILTGNKGYVVNRTVTLQGLE